MPLDLVVAVVHACRAASTDTGSGSRSRAHRRRRARRARRARCAARAAAGARAAPASVVCSDSASAGFTRPSGSRSNTRRSPTVENTRFLWPMPPSRAEQLDRVEHVVEVVRRLAHAHEARPSHRRAARARARPGRRSRRCRGGARGRRGRSCRRRSRPRSRPGSTRRRRRAAAARSRPSGRRASASSSRAEPSGARMLRAHRHERPPRAWRSRQRGAQPRREVGEIAQMRRARDRAPRRAARASRAAASRRPPATAPSALRFAWRSQVALEAHWPSEAANSFFVAAKISRVAVRSSGRRRATIASSCGPRSSAAMRR